MQNRDFKGVWIPKEIWLNEELTLIEKVIFVEIDSLDNEDHCTAGNDYLATFCGCSERKVSDAIKKLSELGYIEVMSFDGRHRKIRVVKNAEETRKICEAATNKVQSNNIDNNTINKESFSKEKEEISEYDSHMYSPEELKNDFLGSSRKRKSTRPKSQSLYSKCMAEINLYTQDLQLHTLLVKYLNLRLEMKDKPLYYNQWKGMLDKLSNIIEDNPGMSYEDVVRQSIEKGYASFFPVNTYSKSKNVFAEGNGLSCEQSDETEEERKESLRRSGRRSEF